MHKVGLDEMLNLNGTNSELEYVEMDSSKRYGRFKDILGKGATKIVYRAFDELLGLEVAWNQVKLNDMLRSPEELQRLYSEVYLLKELDHESIMKFHACWINVESRTFNFITEMFTSGTLREYRHKYRRVHMHAIKNWGCQILKGLAYLHCHDPPVIHRDLKCDNIFVNGHLGEVKIGDLGLSTILCGSHHAHSVIGTPEFMAPELYEEDYDELVDVYSFGMCVLEMLISEYPYSECSNPAQIYKKVTSGKLPKAFYKINDAEAQRFVGRCLSPASERPSASELLRDPFLAVDEDHEDEDLSRFINLPCQKFMPKRKHDEIIPSQPDDSVLGGTNMKITGTMNSEDDTIFLKVQILQMNGQARNIFFPFDISNDTALEVATEMVKELDITDWDPLQIADMIDTEISALIPAWKRSHSLQNYEQHSFTYVEDDDDDDESTPHPSYYICCHSSYQLSLPGLLPSYESTFHQGKLDHDWLQDELRLYDDSSSQCSMNSYGSFNNVNFHEDYSDCMGSQKEESQPTQQTTKCSTRFCPEKSMLSKNQNTTLMNNEHRKLTKVRSLVDIRSQLLHRSLVEEINKRRLFKTVGAVEHIGYRDPVTGKSDELGW